MKDNLPMATIIKQHRAETGLGLKEAQDQVNAMSDYEKRKIAKRYETERYKQKMQFRLRENSQA